MRGVQHATIYHWGHEDGEHHNGTSGRNREKNSPRWKNHGGARWFDYWVGVIGKSPFPVTRKGILLFWSIHYLFFKNFDVFILHDQIGKFTLEPGSFYDMIVDPVVITTTGLTKKDTVVFEVVLVEPGFSNRTVVFCSGSKEVDNVPLIIPLIEYF